MTITARLLAVALLTISFACGDSDDSASSDATVISIFDAEPADAALPDAFICMNTTCGADCADLTSDPAHCGTCEIACTPASGCASSSCSCPAPFLPASATDAAANVNPSMMSASISARTNVVGTDTLMHNVRISYDPGMDPLDTDIDLSTATSPSLRFRYNVQGAGPSGRFGVSAGTLRLTRACAEGVTGTLTGATLIETSGGQGGGTPITDGCTYSNVSLSFDLGAACGSSTDAGVSDAGTADATSN